MTYAVTGMMLPEDRRYASGDRDLMLYSVSAQGGLRADIGFKQYLFNTKISTVPLSGISGSLYYELAPMRGIAYGFGGGVDRVSNGEVTLSVFRLFAQAALWFGN